MQMHVQENSVTNQMLFLICQGDQTAPPKNRVWLFLLIVNPSLPYVPCTGCPHTYYTFISSFIITNSMDVPEQNAIRKFNSSI